MARLNRLSWTNGRKSARLPVARAISTPDSLLVAAVVLAGDPGTRFDTHRVEEGDPVEYPLEKGMEYSPEKGMDQLRSQCILRVVEGRP